jgi:hypothetical protein
MDISEPVENSDKTLEKLITTTVVRPTTGSIKRSRVAWDILKGGESVARLRMRSILSIKK